jgi:hypothetical protein
MAVSAQISDLLGGWYANPMKTPMSASDAAERAGIDLSLIEENLRLTPEQRVLQHEAALELVLQMEAAGRRLRNADSSTPTAPLRS